MSSTAPIGAVSARMSKPPPNVRSSSNARMNDPEIVEPLTSVKTTRVNIAMVTPVRKRVRSG